MCDVTFELSKQYEIYTKSETERKMCLKIELQFELSLVCDIKLIWINTGSIYVPKY